VGAARRWRAFTLLEVILAVALLTLMTGVVIIALGPWRHHQDLQVAAERFAAATRMARADAARLGRRLRLSFDAETGGMALLWEPEPLEAPGEFVAYTRCAWLDMLPADLAKVVYARRRGAVDDWAAGPAAAEEEEFDTIDFYPDGSSDSVEVHLTDAAGMDARLAVIELDGVNGVVRTHLLSEEQLEQRAQDQPR
jgi:type II secretory pathway pseudopilin PulG